MSAVKMKINLIEDVSLKILNLGIILVTFTNTDENLTVSFSHQNIWTRHKILVLIRSVQKPPLNAHSEISSRARKLFFWSEPLSLSRQGSGKSGIGTDLQEPSLLPDAIST